jgi:hypothetical protein
MPQKKSEAGSLAKQIDNAKRSIETWPAWLRESARFEGKNHSFDRPATDSSVEDSITGGASTKPKKQD